MKGLQKQISFGLVFLLMIILTTPLEISAESATGSSGKMRYKTERIDRGKNDGNHKSIETELDKIFPTLFHEETVDMINLTKKKQDEYADQQERSLFEVLESPDTVLNDIKKQSLFTADYTAPKTSKVNGITEEGQASSMGKGLLASLGGLLLVLCGGIYTMLLKL